MKHVRVRNHSRFQHYKRRTPPWIKWHREYRDSYRFTRLPDATKFHAVGLAMLASSLDNHLPADPGWLAERIGASSPVDIEGLLAAEFLEWCQCGECSEQSASKSLADRKQSACLEAETERETEAKKLPVTSAPRSDGSDLVQEVWKEHIEARRIFFTKRNGQAPRMPNLTSKLKTLIRQALKEHGLDATKAAGRGIFLSDFHTGKNEDGRLYLSPTLCWSITAKRDNVEKFSSLVFDRRDRR